MAEDLDLTALESAAKAALRPETWAGTGIPGMSINPTTMIALISALRASWAENERMRDDAIARSDKDRLDGEEAAFPEIARLVARATTAEAEVGEWKRNANDYFAALQAAEADLEQSRDNANEFKANYQRWKAMATTAEAKLAEMEAKHQADMREAVKVVGEEARARGLAEANVQALTEALEPFTAMAEVMDDWEDLIDDEDRKEHATIVFGGMTMGDWDRDDFRRAQAALSRTRPSGGDVGGEQSQ